MKGRERRFEVEYKTGHIIHFNLFHSFLLVFFSLSLSVARALKWEQREKWKIKRFWDTNFTYYTSCVMSINDILIDEFAAELDVLKVRLTYLVKLISWWSFVLFCSLSQNNHRGMAFPFFFAHLFEMWDNKTPHKYSKFVKNYFHQ